MRTRLFPTDPHPPPHHHHHGGHPHPALPPSEPSQRFHQTTHCVKGGEPPTPHTGRGEGRREKEGHREKRKEGEENREEEKPDEPNPPRNHREECEDPTDEPTDVNGKLFLPRNQN